MTHAISYKFINPTYIKLFFPGYNAEEAKAQGEAS